MAVLLDRWTPLQSADQPSEAMPADIARTPRLLLLIGISSLLVCLAPLAHMLRLFAGFLARYGYDEVFLRLVGASLALVSGAFLAAALIAFARVAATRARIGSPQANFQENPARRGLGRNRLLAPLARMARRLPARADLRATLAGIPEAFVMLGGAGIAIVLLTWRWPQPVEVELPSRYLFLRGAILIIGAFPLLLAERAFAGPMGTTVAEAQALQRLLRLSLCTFAIEALVALIEGYGFGFVRLLEPVLRLLLLVVALEIGARTIAVFFQPAREPMQRAGFLSSTVATVLTPELVSQTSWRQSLEEQIGIDLSRSWALRFLRSALLPVVLLLLLFAWGLSGVTILAGDQRGIYERLGRPVAVLQPGLHLGLPWPLGDVRRIDFGEIHALSLGIPEGEGAMPAPEVVGAEEAPPASADRLWDQSHPTETSYLIASDASGRSAFQVVNVDVALIWRVGLTDEAALASAYRIRDPQNFLRAFAGRLLARYFSTRTLLGALGEKREGVAEELRRELQTALGEANTGIELVAVVIEAIHPPAKAADSYHEVQAARIRSQAMISEARRRAIAALSEATRSATEKLASAKAGAFERVSLAQSDALRFATDEKAFLAAGSPYLFERYLSAITRDFASAPITLLDHRIAGTSGETVIDLRNFRTLVPSGPDEDIGEKEPNK
ncbi:MAG: protease modulator HflK [Hyphomicrobiales bacterium]|nr:protease modulator HflK [Hyphomicrobiales bacterium]